MVRPPLALVLIGSLAVVGQPSLTAFAPSYGWKAQSARTAYALSYGWHGREPGETPSHLLAERTARLAAVNPCQDADV